MDNGVYNRFEEENAQAEEAQDQHKDKEDQARPREGLEPNDSDRK